jgi:hypothetical protein
MGNKKSKEKGGGGGGGGGKSGTPQTNTAPDSQTPKEKKQYKVLLIGDRYLLLFIQYL